MPCDCKAPTIKYSTPAALSDSINSRKSLCSAIGIVPCSKFEEDLNALLGGEAEVFLSLSGVGFFVAAKFAGYFVHPFHSKIAAAPARPA